MQPIDHAWALLKADPNMEIAEHSLYASPEQMRTREGMPDWGKGGFSESDEYRENYEGQTMGVDGDKTMNPIIARLILERNKALDFPPSGPGSRPTKQTLERRGTQKPMMGDFVVNPAGVESRSYPARGLAQRFRSRYPGHRKEREDRLLQRRRERGDMTYPYEQ
tara:strand:- start:51 stop:545 length:495 start_codon:yes stop_codon:yes gene_type:complete